jgi:hypothetical protein
LNSVDHLDQGLDQDVTIRLRPGEGAAGNAFAKGRWIYIPNVRNGIGFSIADSRYEFTHYAFKPGRDQFRSILSVPIIPSALAPARPCTAVLNLVSDHVGFLTDDHFALGELAAHFLELAYNR